MNLQMALKAQGQGLDMVWVGCRLVTPEQRREFALFTIRQQQPYLVDSFRRAGLDTQAGIVEALDWGNVLLAERVLDAASSAAAHAAKDAAMAAARAAWLATWLPEMDAARATARNPAELADIDAFQREALAADNVAWEAAWGVLRCGSGVSNAAMGAARDAAKAASGALATDPFVAAELASAPARLARHTTEGISLALRLAADLEGSDDAKAANLAASIADVAATMALAATYSDQSVVNAFLTTREEQIRWIWEAVSS